MVAVPLGALAALVALFALALAGWGSETSAFAQLARDRYQLVVACVAGGASGGLIAWAIRPHRAWTAAGVAVGTMPALARVTAYFVDAY